MSIEIKNNVVLLPAGKPEGARFAFFPPLRKMEKRGDEWTAPMNDLWTFAFSKGLYKPVCGYTLFFFENYTFGVFTSFWKKFKLRDDRDQNTVIMRRSDKNGSEKN
jgi:hypothetical protein